MPEPDPVADWARCGAMALTGRADGPPLVAPGRPATTLLNHLEQVRRNAVVRTGWPPALPGCELLGERAAIAGFSRRGPWSCGAAFRAVPTTDGWFGLSLARDDDVVLVPALVEHETVDSAWEAIEAWAAGITTAEAVARARLLDLPCAAWPPETGTRPGVLVEQGGRHQPAERPLIVDLTSLWAGPLCAHLLGLTGCVVVKVESWQRPDGTRRGPSRFFDLLHGGHSSVAVDFTDPHDRDRLVGLMQRADLVLEGSRARALRRLGIIAEDLVASGTSWLSITARGRDSEAVGFGDDVAVAAGLAIQQGRDLLPAGDALADPLTGVAAAAAASEALLADNAVLVDVSMLDVAREAVTGPPEPHTVWRDDGAWWVESVSGRHLVAGPAARAPHGRGPGLGADNEAWLR
ncbi:CoA transferase [Planosporangium sp. 12N6]|uniref:CoA transferase n=1 Tax=Planosporangium spinosum TaxID=3402278 RepID=UPI003CF11B4E